MQTCTVAQSIVDDEIAAHHELPEQMLTAEMNAAYAVKRRSRFVGEVACQSAVDERQLLFVLRRGKACRIFLHRIMRRTRDALHQAVFVDEQLVGKDLHAHEWLTADEGVSPKLLLCRIDGLHDVALLFADQLIVDGDGGVEIHRQLRGDSDEICRFCRADKILFGVAQLH